MVWAVSAAPLKITLLTPPERGHIYGRFEASAPRNPPLGLCYIAAVLERADWIASRPGGRGAVRELCDALLVARNEWDAILEGLSS